MKLTKLILGIILLCNIGYTEVISARKAVEISKGALESLGVRDLSSATGTQATRKRGPLGTEVWSVRPSSYVTVEVDVKSGLIRNIRNVGPTLESLRNKSFARPYVIRTQLEAKNVLNRFARALRIPNSYNFERFNFYLKGDKRVSDTEQPAMASAVFCSRPNGLPFLELGNYATLSVDLHTGELRHYSLKNFCIIEPSYKRVAKRQAQEVASAILSSSDLNSSARTPAKVILGYVLSSSQLSNGKALKAPIPMRLAWSVEKGNTSVYVDAKSGRVLRVKKPAVTR